MLGEHWDAMSSPCMVIIVKVLIRKVNKVFNLYNHTGAFFTYTTFIWLPCLNTLRKELQNNSQRPLFEKSRLHVCHFPIKAQNN